MRARGNRGEEGEGEHKDETQTTYMQIVYNSEVVELKLCGGHKLGEVSFSLLGSC